MIFFSFLNCFKFVNEIVFLFFSVVSDLLSPDLSGRTPGPGTPEQHFVRIHRKPERVPKDRLGPGLTGKGLDLHRDKKAVDSKTRDESGHEMRKS